MSFYSFSPVNAMVFVLRTNAKISLLRELNKRFNTTAFDNEILVYQAQLKAII